MITDTEQHVLDVMLSKKQYTDAIEYAYKKCTQSVKRIHVQVLDGGTLPSPGYGMIYYIHVTVLGSNEPSSTSQWRSKPVSTWLKDRTWTDAGLVLSRSNEVDTIIRVEVKRAGWILWDTVVATTDIRLSSGEDTELKLTTGAGYLRLHLRHLVDGKLTTLGDLKALNLKEHRLELRDNCTILLHSIQRAGNQRAVLWLPGRNDCFHHPQVANVFLDNGIDVYILNWRGLASNGRSLGLGTEEWDPRFATHVPSGTFNTMCEDIDAGLLFIKKTKVYEQLFQYSHSTGALLMATYLLTKGNGAFDAFYLNSPFLDWGFVGGNLLEYGLKQIVPGLSTMLPTRANNTVVTSGTGANAFRTKIYSTHEFDTRSNTMIDGHVTAGFINASSECIHRLEKMHAHGQCLTTKPVGCISSRSDDVLVQSEISQRIKWWSRHRPVADVILDTGSHDVFMSCLRSDVDQALDHLRLFLSEVSSGTCPTRMTP